MVVVLGQVAVGDVAAVSSSLWVKGSVPRRSFQASHTTMIPIDSYHEARVVS